MAADINLGIFKVRVIFIVTVFVMDGIKIVPLLLLAIYRRFCYNESKNKNGVV